MAARAWEVNREGKKEKKGRCIPRKGPTVVWLLSAHILACIAVYNLYQCRPTTGTVLLPRTVMVATADSSVFSGSVHL